MGVTQFGITLQGSTDPEDPPVNGRADVDRFADFMRALQPPPRLPEDASAKGGGGTIHQHRLHRLPCLIHPYVEPILSCRRPQAGFPSVVWCGGALSDVIFHRSETSCCMTWVR